MYSAISLPKIFQYLNVICLIIKTNETNCKETTHSRHIEQNYTPITLLLWNLNIKLMNKKEELLFLSYLLFQRVLQNKSAMQTENILSSWRKQK